VVLSALRLAVLGLVCLALTGCVARKVVTVPVKATGAVVGAVF
jgi:hypothetical protein